MKKYISIFLCAILLLGALPFQALATENTSEHDKVIALACEAFPEYADILRNPPIATRSRSAGEADDKVVYRGTRDISDNHNVSIAVYQSGYAVVTEASIFDVTVTDSQGSMSGSNYVGSASYVVTYTDGGGVFKLEDVKYTIRNGKSGIFTSYGTYSTDKNKECTVGSVSKSSTKMSYALTFNKAGAGSTWRYTSFELYFSGGALRAETTD